MLAKSSVLYGISIHTLREEGDSKNREKTRCFCISINNSAQFEKEKMLKTKLCRGVRAEMAAIFGAKESGRTCALRVRTGKNG